MDGREGRCTFGFLLLGLAPVMAAAGGSAIAVFVFILGLLVATTAAFA